MQTPGSRCWIIATVVLLHAAPIHAQEPARTISLQETIELALETDPLAVAAETDLATAEADRMEARGSWLPLLTLSTGYSKSSQARINRSTGLLSSESYSAGAQASMVLFAGGQRIAENRAANARVAASEAAIRRIEKAITEPLADQRDVDVRAEAAMHLLDVYRRHLDYGDLSGENAEDMQRLAEAERRLRLVALDAERDELYRLRRAFAIDDIVHQKLVGEIDLMEASLLGKSAR